MTVYPSTPSGRVHWVYDDPTGLPEQPVLVVPNVPFLGKAA